MEHFFLFFQHATILPGVHSGPSNGDIQLSLLVRLMHILSSHGGRKAELT